MVVAVAYAEHQAAHGHGHEGWGWVSFLEKNLLPKIKKLAKLLAGFDWLLQSHPKYKYSYGVTDKHTHDNKHASEWRDGDTVKGHYALQEPDGHWRTVRQNYNFHLEIDLHEKNAYQNLFD